MSEHPCAGPSCARPCHEGTYLCDGCADTLADTLTEMPELLADLELTATRQARTGEAGHHLTGHEYGLPFHLDAAALLDTVENMLTAIASAVMAGEYGARPEGYRPASLCVWLSTRLAYLRGQREAGDWAASVARFKHEMTRMVDSRPERVYCGPCGAPVEDPGDPSRTMSCPADLYAQRHRARIVCQACRAQHDMAERQAWLDALAMDSLLTVTELRDYVGRKFPHVDKPSRQWIYALKKRNHLMVKGRRSVTDKKGEVSVVELFRVGDLMARVGDRLGAAS